jgi:hypothetical protein
VADFPLYTFDPRTARYRSKRSGRFVDPTAVRRALDAALQNQAAKARALAEQLRTGTIDAEAWELGMRDVIKSTQLFASAAGRGGFAQMDAHAFGLVGQRVRQQYTFLAKRVEQIVNGLPLNGNFLQGAEGYAKAAKPAFIAAMADTVESSGFDEVRSITHPAEHCDLCLSEEAKGFQPIGKMIPIGERTCLSHDKCSVEFRNSQTGEILAA